MSVQMTLSRITTLQREIQSLQSQLSNASKDRASKTTRIAQVKRSITSSTSPSVLQSKVSEISRLEDDIARINQKEADVTKRVADKTQELHRCQQKYYEEQNKEQKKLQESLESMSRREQNRRDQQWNQVVTLPQELGVEDGVGLSEVAYDAFISYASEDQEDLVRPLAEVLRNLGYEIWYDEFQLTVGDSLRRSIDRGLAQSRFGIVVLSPDFFSKQWPQYELDGMVTKEVTGGKVILPIWHKVSKNEVMSYSPTLADRLALSTANYTVDELAEKLGQVLKRN